MTPPRFAFPEAPPSPPVPSGFVCCPVALPAVAVIAVHQLYQIAQQRAAEAARPTLYDRFSYRSTN